MKSKIETFFYQEIELAKKNIAEKNFESAFRHLERAHVLGQSFVSLHSVAHYHMLRHAIFSANIKEIIGQIIRLPLGVIGSAVGIVPVGNTGGSNVSMFKKMPIEKEIKEIMQLDKET